MLSKQILRALAVLSVLQFSILEAEGNMMCIEMFTLPKTFITFTPLTLVNQPKANEYNYTLDRSTTEYRALPVEAPIEIEYNADIVTDIEGAPPKAPNWTLTLANTKAGKEDPPPDQYFWYSTYWGSSDNATNVRHWYLSDLGSCQITNHDKIPDGQPGILLRQYFALLSSPARHSVKPLLAPLMLAELYDRHFPPLLSPLLSLAACSS